MKRNSQARVAQEAAQFMVDGVESEYLHAKERAMMMLGLTNMDRMPSNREVRQWIGRLAKLEIGEEEVKRRVRAMREIAAAIMAELDDFDPFLIGSTLSGEIRENSDIDLHVYADNFASIKDVLESAGYEEIEEEHIENRKGHFVHLKWYEGAYPVEITIIPVSERAVIPMSSVTNKPMKRADLTAVQRLLTTTLLTLLFALSVSSQLTLPALAANLFTEGVSAFGEKNYALALTKLALYLKTNPGDANAHYYLASTYHHLNRIEEAKRQYTYILTAFPGTQASTYSAEGLTRLSTAPLRTAAVAVANNYQDPDEDRVTLRRVHNHLIVATKINGKNLDMAFDTGAETTCVTLDAWRRLGYPAPTDKPSGMSSGIGGLSPMWSREAEVTVGKFKRTLPLNILKDMPVDGLIGQNFFQDLQYNLSGNADYIHIFAKGSQRASRSVPMNTIDIPFTKSGNNMLVTVKINGMPCEMFFDTGASFTLLDPMVFRQMHLKPTGDVYDMKMSGAGGGSTGIAFKIESISLGDVVKRDFMLTVGGPGISLLGQDFFKDHRYVIDNEKRYIRFFR